ncbi:MAG: two-component sensor histidine kinase, partial [Gammaproteobacteria bacterium]
MDKERQARDRLIMSRLIDALPEAVIVIGAADRVVAVNAPARNLFPALRPDDLLARSLRAPDVLDTVRRVRASGAAQRVTWIERVPVERYFELNAAPMDGLQFEP